MKNIIRTRLAKDIVCEVAFPERQQGKVALVCSGAPTLPPHHNILNYLASKGYVAIGMRYRGTWESDGNFLEYSPAKDVVDCIEDLVKKKKVTDLLTKETIAVKVQYIDLFGGSFGGPAVLLNSKNKHVRKVIALAPVVDWNTLGPVETFEEYRRYSEEGYGGAYRVKKKSDWNKLLRKDFYNPITMLDKIDPKKCFILQAKDDDSCPVESLVAFQKLLPTKVYYKPKGGHFGNKKLLKKFFWKKIEQFLRK